MSFCSLVYLGRQAVWPRKPVAATSCCAGMPAVQRSTGQRWKDMTEVAEGLLQAPMNAKLGEPEGRFWVAQQLPALVLQRGNFTEILLELNTCRKSTV